MKKYLFTLAIVAFSLVGCKSSREVSKTNQNEVWQTLLVKQLEANVENQIITVKYNKLKNKNQYLKKKSYLTIKNSKGTVKYKKGSGNKKILVNKKNGKITIKKGLKKGTYKVKVKVKAAGNASYDASTWKTVTFKIKVTAKEKKQIFCRKRV